MYLVSLKTRVIILYLRVGTLLIIPIFIEWICNVITSFFSVIYHTLTFFCILIMIIPLHVFHYSRSLIGDCLEAINGAMCARDSALDYLHFHSSALSPTKKAWRQLLELFVLFQYNMFTGLWLVFNRDLYREIHKYIVLCL